MKTTFPTPAFATPKSALLSGVRDNARTRAASVRWTSSRKKAH
ncbi:hypothetical protein [Streptomyces sp. TLI_55]|nr:hypothetical protein [Streptomyces sp. TLI_55]